MLLPCLSGIFVENFIEIGSLRDWTTDKQTIWSTWLYSNTVFRIRINKNIKYIIIVNILIIRELLALIL